VYAGLCGDIFLVEIHTLCGMTHDFYLDETPQDVEQLKENITDRTLSKRQSN